MTPLLLRPPIARAVAAAALIVVAVLVAMPRRPPALPDAPDVLLEPASAPLDAQLFAAVPSIVALPENSRPKMTPSNSGVEPASPVDGGSAIAASHPFLSASATKPPVVEAPGVALVAAAAPAPGQQPIAITITGCLERDDDEFQLKDTEGENAPRSRSWTSGFLRQRNRAVGVIDTFNQFRLTDHVGERVTVTGMLVDGEMELGSLRRIAASCD